MKAKEINRVVAWFSCGAASAVAAKLAIAKYGDKCEVVYCDTSSDEHPDNLRFLADCERWFGRKIIRLQSDYADRWEVYEKTGWLVGPAGARCTTELKKNLRTAYQRWDDVHVLGYTLDERHRVERFEQANPELYTEWPLIDHQLTKQDCYAMLAKAGIKLPAMYALGYANNNCFSGKTEFITQSGIKSFSESVGDTVVILNRDGWQSAKVEHFGVQRIVTIELSNGERKHTIETTLEHRWFVPKYTHKSQGVIEKTTGELTVGDRPLINFKTPDLPLSRIGVQHGFVFGDGTLHRTKAQKPYTSAYIADGKEEILSWFDKEMCNSRHINGLPTTFKQIPNTNNQSYLAGFLAGLIASDGCVSKSGVTISNKSESTINRIVEIAQTLGMVAWARRSRVRDTNYKRNARMCQMVIPKICVPQSMIIRNFHRKRIGNSFTNPKAWRVESVAWTNRLEDVYCVVVDGSPEFTLANNILTGNCIGCVKGQKGYWNKIRRDFPEVFARMAKEERRLNVAICKDTGPNGERIKVFLDELDPEAGNYEHEPNMSCSIFCQMASEEVEL